MRRKKHDWAAKIKAWTDSGLPVSVYCKKHGLPISGFYKAKNRIEAEPARNNPRPTILDVTSVLASAETTSEPMPAQSSTPTLRIMSKDGHILEVFL